LKVLTSVSNFFRSSSVAAFFANLVFCRYRFSRMLLNADPMPALSCGLLD